MKPPRTPDIDTFLTPDMETIEPDELSKFGYNVPDLVFEYGDLRAVPGRIARVLPTILRTKKNIERGFKSLSDNPRSPLRTADQSFFEGLSSFARSLGILDIGYTEVPRSHIFSNKKILFDKAIVITMAMEKQKMALAPEIQAGKEVWRTYHALGIASNRIAAFLREHGFSAQPGAALGGETNYCMLAQKAGLGWIGKHGLLISPEAGPSLRIAAVYTNIENLPMTDARAEGHNWISDFCSSCLHCVSSCPGRAIYQTNRVDELGRETAVDLKKCVVPFSKTLGCSVCIRTCTFFKGDYALIKKNFMKARSESL